MSNLIHETSVIEDKHNNASFLNKEWYALYTRSRHEQTVNDRLVSKGFETFLPLVERWSQRKDRKKKISVPLFPSYLFVNASLIAENHISIVSTPGIVNLLSFNGIPLKVKLHEIESLKLLTKSGLCIDPADNFKKGDWVEVVRGPLKGVVGVLDVIGKNRRIVVSIAAIEQAVSVNLDRCLVKKCL